MIATEKTITAYDINNWDSVTFIQSFFFFQFKLMYIYLYYSKDFMTSQICKLAAVPVHVCFHSLVSVMRLSMLRGSLSPSPPKGEGVGSFAPFSLATPPGAVALATPAGPVAGAPLGGEDVFSSAFSSCSKYRHKRTQRTLCFFIAYCSQETHHLVV